MFDRWTSWYLGNNMNRLEPGTGLYDKYGKDCGIDILE